MEDPHTPVDPGTPKEFADLAAMANVLRRDVINMTTDAGSGHPTSCLSCAEIMSTLFFHEMRWDPNDSEARDVDEFILSKGHAAPILWASLFRAGAIEEKLESLRRIDSSLEGHPTPRNRWVKVATGSLGQGLASANGIALAKRMDGIDGRVYCLLGDGECSEGSVWEAAQFAAEQGLSNLVAIVDVNGLQQSSVAPSDGHTEILARRFEAFGWHTVEIDGHHVGDIANALASARSNKDGPTAILAKTSKGKGVTFLENQQGHHGIPLTPSERDAAFDEIPCETVSIKPVPRRVDSLPTQPPGQSLQPLNLDYKLGEEVATRVAFGQALRELGESYPSLVVLDGDVQNSTHTDLFHTAYPDRFFEANIAEQNMIGTALGLATSGKRVCVATFSAFLTRAYDFIRMAGYSAPDHLLICGSHAGVSIGEDGPSQMGLEDIAMFRAIPGATILYPCDAVSAARLTEQAIQTHGIVYLRTTRGKTPVIYGDDEVFHVGGSRTVVCSVHDVLTIVACGITVHQAMQAQQVLQQQHNLYVRVIDAYSIMPLDVSTLQESARVTGNLLVVEDHSMSGGLGDEVSAEIGRLANVYRMGVTQQPRSGSSAELLERHHLSSRQIVLKVLAIVEQGHKKLA